MTSRRDEQTHFRVVGFPATKGSKVVMQSKHGNFWLKESNASAVNAFTSAVVAQAKRYCAERQLLQCAVAIDLSFFVFGKGPVGEPAWERKRGNGDIDKFMRCVFDALTTAAAWGDDMQVTDLCARKRWTDKAEDAGVVIALEMKRPELQEDEN